MDFVHGDLDGAHDGDDTHFLFVDIRLLILYHRSRLQILAFYEICRGELLLSSDKTKVAQIILWAGFHDGMRSRFAILVVVAILAI